MTVPRKEDLLSIMISEYGDQAEAQKLLKSKSGSTHGMPA
jgi:hypothetical protein